MRVYERLGEYISKNEIDLAALAARCGIEASSLKAILCGERKLYADELREVCIALNLSPEFFVCAASA